MRKISLILVSLILGVGITALNIQSVWAHIPAQASYLTRSYFPSGKNLEEKGIVG